MATFDPTQGQSSGQGNVLEGILEPERPPQDPVIGYKPRNTTVMEDLGLSPEQLTQPGQQDAVTPEGQGIQRRVAKRRNVRVLEGLLGEGTPQVQKRKRERLGISETIDLKNIPGIESGGSMKIAQAIKSHLDTLPSYAQRITGLEESVLLSSSRASRMADRFHEIAKGYEVETKKLKNLGVGKNEGLKPRRDKFLAKTEEGDFRFGPKKPKISEVFNDIADTYEEEGEEGELPSILFGPVDIFEDAPEPDTDLIRLTKSATGGALGSGISTLRGLEALTGRTIFGNDAPILDIQKALEVENPVFLDKLASGFGSTLTFFIPGAGVAKGVSALSKGSKVISFISAAAGVGTMSGIEALAESGEIYEQAIAKGYTKKEAAALANHGAALNLITLILTNSVFPAAKGGAIKRMLATAPSEGIQEAVQTMISNYELGARDLASITEGAFESFVIGGIVGGIIGGATDGFDVRQGGKSTVDPDYMSILEQRAQRDGIIGERRVLYLKPRDKKGGPERKKEKELQFTGPEDITPQEARAEIESLIDQQKEIDAAGREAEALDPATANARNLANEAVRVVGSPVTKGIIQKLTKKAGFAGIQELTPSEFNSLIREAREQSPSTAATDIFNDILAASQEVTEEADPSVFQDEIASLVQERRTPARKTRTVDELIQEFEGLQFQDREVGKGGLTGQDLINTLTRPAPKAQKIEKVKDIKPIDLILSTADIAANDRFIERLTQATQDKSESSKPMTRAEFRKAQFEAEALPPSDIKNKALKMLKDEQKRMGTKEQKLGRELAIEKKKTRQLAQQKKALERTIQKGKHEKTVQKISKAIRSTSLSAETTAKLEPVTRSIKLRTRPIKGLAKLIKEAKEKFDNNDMLPSDVMDTVAEMEGKTMSELSEIDLDLLLSAVKNIIHLSDMQNKVFIDGQIKTREETVKEIVKDIKNRKGKNNDGDISEKDVAAFEAEFIARSDFIPKKQRAGKVKKFVVASLPHPVKAFQMDGGKEGGVHVKIFEKQLNQSRSDALEHTQKRDDFFRNRIKDIDFGNGKDWSDYLTKKATLLRRLANRLKNTPEQRRSAKRYKMNLSSGQEIGITRGEKISMYLTSKREAGLKHLVSGGFSFETSKTKIYQFSMQDVKNLQQSMTKDELTVARAMRDFLNGLQKDATNKISMDLNGVAVLLEDNYWRIHVNEITLDKKLQPKIIQVRKTIEGMGMLQKLVDSENPIIIHDAFSDFQGQTRAMAGYIGFAKTIRTGNLILNDPLYQTVMTEEGFGLHMKSMQKLMDALNGDYSMRTDAESVLLNLHGKAKSSKIVINPFTWMKQAVSVVLAIPEIGAKNMGKGSSKVIGKKTFAKMYKYSAVFRNRMEGFIGRELGELSAGGETRRMTTGEKDLQQKIGKGIQTFDMQAIGRIWEGAEAKVKSEKPDLTGDKFYHEVAKVAEQVVSRTQPTYFIESRSDIGMIKTIWVRELTAFSSQTNKIFGMVSRASTKYANSNKTAADKAEYMTVIYAVLINAALVTGIDEGRKAWRRQEHSVLTTFIQNTFGVIYGVPTFLGAIISKLKRGTYAGFRVSTPSIQTLDNAVNGAVETVLGVKALVYDEQYEGGKRIGEDKWKTELPKGLIKLADGITSIRYGVPVKTPLKDAALLLDRVDQLFKASVGK